VRWPDDLRQRPGPVAQRPVAKDATGGLKDALTQGAQLAVKQLGTPGGFSNNPDVKIELPGKLGKVASKMKHVRHG
jgi:hypothetical protein